MKKIILFGILMFTLISVTAALEICEEEEDPFPSCLIVTPAGTTCSTYNLYHPDNSTNVSTGAMGALNADAGIYLVVFNGSDAGGWTVQLCDNSTAYLNVKTTDETDLTTILANQVTIDAGITSVSSDMGANFTDTNTSLTRIELDLNTPSQYMNVTGAAVVHVDDKTGYSLINQEWENDSDAITRYTSLSSDIGLNFTNQSDDRRIQFIDTNNTLIQIINSFLDDATNGLAALKTLIDTLQTSLNNHIAGLSLGMDSNRTQLQTDLGTDIDLSINQSRDIENLTRIQIIEMAEAGNLANTTDIGQAVLRETILANRTITFNYAWDLINGTTVYHDLGYEMTETYIYNDTTNNWYLNGTEFRRTL